MIQTDRIHNPYPLTWEIPLGCTAILLALAALGVQLGRSLANWAGGAGWSWPHGRHLFTSIPATLVGNPSVGLNPPPTPPATPAAVIGWIITVEIVLAVIAVALAVWALRRWGPGRLRGMATPAEAKATLGPGRLRRVRSVIRPDLYPPATLRRRS